MRRHCRTLRHVRRGGVRIDPEQSIFGRDGNPLDYPSRLPESPTLLLGTEAHAIDADDLAALRLSGTGELVDDVLRARGSAPLGKRVVSVAFGANRDLRNLAWKFANYHDATGREPSGDLVVVPASIPDADVVASNIGYWGYVYGALILHRPPELERPYLRGTRAPVALLLVDEHQMHMLHASEGVPRPGESERGGVSCDVALIDVEVGGRTLAAQLYLVAMPYLSFDGGRPVAFENVASSGRSERTHVLAPLEIWQEVWARLGLRSRLGLEPETAIDRLRQAARRRRAGGVVDPAADRLYTDLRCAISQMLPLEDADGRVRTATDGMPRTLSATEAWSFRHGRFDP